MLNNNLKPAGQMKDKTVEYEVNGSQVRLSPSIVRNYLVNGDGRVTDGEVAMFINLCRYQRLNPLIRDAYLIKFGSQPATIVLQLGNGRELARWLLSDLRAVEKSSPEVLSGV